MKDINTYVDEQLSSMSDEAYRKFQQPLIPTVPANRIIGVRTPALRRFARDFGRSADAARFLKALPHKSYEAYNLHAFLIEQINDFDLCIEALDVFLPYVDNWATCDMMSPKILGRYPQKLILHIDRWIGSRYTYEVRFGILCLMRHFLDDGFTTPILNKVAVLQSDEYYINMARAWFFATALAKQWTDTLDVITNNRLDKFTHNKTIQKAVESYRITDGQKSILKTLKRK